jgi:uncharacterized membrane protein
LVPYRRLLPESVEIEQVRTVRVLIQPDDLGAVLAEARRHDARSPVAIAVTRAAGDEIDAVSSGTGNRHDIPENERGSDAKLVLLTLPNSRVGSFIAAVRSRIDDAEFTLVPVGALPLDSQTDGLGEQVRDVSRLSTLELVVASLQSVGGWRGMFLFSVLAGVIGTYGLIFDVAYVLVAAMLINPMGAPALVAVIGLAIGDARVFTRGGARFLVSLAVQAATAALLGFGYGLSTSTATMEQVASLSLWAVVVALAAGAAGAQAQVRSERDSLVSGTAAGFMVAAALAPPAAVLGLAIPLARWDYAALMGFLLGLQFLAITLGGAAVLYFSGVRPGQPSAGRGSTRLRSALVAGLVVITSGMVLWQTRLEPDFQLADLSRTALEIGRDALEDVPDATLIEASARFTRRNMPGRTGESILYDIVLERGPEASSDDELERRVRERIERMTAERMHGVVPYVRISLIPPPDTPRPSGRAP